MYSNKCVYGSPFHGALLPRTPRLKSLREELRTGAQTGGGKAHRPDAPEVGLCQRIRHLLAKHRNNFPVKPGILL